MIDWKHISLVDVAAFVAERLREQEIETVLVGGACVTIYSNNRYQSYDVDFATYEDMKRIKKAMLSLGFSQKGKYFTHENCPWLVEFVAPPVAVGSMPITEFKEIKLRLGTIRLLRPEDSVKDRLAAYFHWNDRQSLEQAIEICLACPIDLGEVELWAIQENHMVQFQLFAKKLAWFRCGKRRVTK